MSILIPGMKMPTSCFDCPMCYDSIGCILTGEQWWSDSHVYLDFSPNKERMWNCPLIELPPHGRLIDADALMLRVDCHGTNKFGMLDEDIREFIGCAPTIIPADGGDT